MKKHKKFNEAKEVALTEIKLEKTRTRKVRREVVQDVFIYESF